MKIASHVEGTKAAVYVDGIAKGMTQEQVEEAVRKALAPRDATPAAGSWVSVKDRLPTWNRWVLVVFESFSGKKSISMARYGDYYRPAEWELFDDDNGDVIEQDSFNGSITHWMPLPELPEEG